MSELPDKLWLRRGEVLTYLQISREALSKLIDSGVLVPKYFDGMTRAYFERSDVAKLKPEAKKEMAK